MSNKLIKTGLAFAVASAISGVANAGDIVLTSQAVGVEASKRSSGAAFETLTTPILYRPGTSLGDQDVITFTLSSGQEFASGPYTLRGINNPASRAISANLLNATGGNAGGNSISFRLNGSFVPTTSIGFALVSGADYTNNGVGGIPSQAYAVPITIKNISTGGKAATISAQTKNSADTLTIDSASDYELVEGFTEFTSVVSSATGTSRTVDVAKGRTLFTDGTSKASFGIAFRQVSTTVGTFAPTTDGTRDVALTTADSVKITLSGDMSGISSIIGDDDSAFTIDTSANTATLSLDASALYTSSKNLAVAINTDETTQLEGRTMKATVEFTLADEGTSTGLSSSTVSTWTVNGMTATIPHLSLATTGFISWLKIANNGSLDADVELTGTYTLADGTSATTTKTLVKAVKAKSVSTISEAEMLTALGLDSSQVADVSLTVDVAAEANNIQIHAEKKSGETRQALPVLYRTDSTRKYFQ